MTCASTPKSAPLGSTTENFLGFMITHRRINANPNKCTTILEMHNHANGKRCMYIDYTNLNKVFPKDAYPLPSINKLVDGTFGFQLLSFLDAYSGYNQIKMHPPDEEKTAFIMEDINFYYRVMSFGLKNVGATYQRLMGLSLHTTNRMKCQGLCGWSGSLLGILRQC